MKYKRTCEVDENGKYHNIYSLFIPFSAFPSEFQDDLKVGSVEVPEVRITKDGLYIEEESFHG